MWAICTCDVQPSIPLCYRFLQNTSDNNIPYQRFIIYIPLRSALSFLTLQSLYSPWACGGVALVLGFLGSGTSSSAPRLRFGRVVVGGVVAWVVVVPTDLGVEKAVEFMVDLNTSNPNEYIYYSTRVSTAYFFSSWFEWNKPLRGLNYYLYTLKI